MRSVAGNAAAPAARCRNRRRGRFIAAPDAMKLHHAASVRKDPAMTLSGETTDALLCATGKASRGGGNMHKHIIVALTAMTLWGGAAFGQAAPGGARTVPPAPVGKAGYFANSDIQNIWKDLEARQVLYQRVVGGGRHSSNLR